MLSQLCKFVNSNYGERRQRSKRKKTHENKKTTMKLTKRLKVLLLFTGEVQQHEK